MNYSDEELLEEIRRICALLKEEVADSPQAGLYCVQLQAATWKLMRQLKAWDESSESDGHQGEARQSYRGRATHSAKSFAEGLGLLNPKKSDSEKNKD